MLDVVAKMASVLRRKRPVTSFFLDLPKNSPFASESFLRKPSQNPHPLTPSTSYLNNNRVQFIRPFSTKSTAKFPEYQMPSVSWGVIQGRKEKLVSRVIICDYLKGIGIIPEELEDLELPSTVEVMRERVEFLQKLGLTIDDINEYPLMLGCSVRKNIIPVLGYLEKIGIQRPKLGEFVKNYPQCLHASVVVELVPVIKFLRGLDVEKQDIGYVLMKYPELLGFKLEGTMSTSVAYLVSIGVHPRDIGPMVTQYPYVLGMRVGTMIKPLVDYLVSLGLQKKILARMFEKRAYLLGYDLEDTVKPNVECLISFGIRQEAIASVIAQYPQILGLPLKAKLSSQQYFFNLKLKVDPDGFARVIEKMPQIVSLNQHVIMKPVEFLLGRAVPAEDVAKMIVKFPQLVALQVGLMKNSYYFFKSEMGRPLKELVEFPEYFTYSLESRIKPRFQRLQSKGISCSLAWFLNCSDQRFEERLHGHYIEAESAGPSFFMGGKLELPGNEIVSEEEDESDDEILYRRTVSL
ncbi:transcription termination factor MTERF4, chloroplastic-like [Coffea arabica]|uniref:Transcription termination factor MTERF4, chloroplastic-like n=1 Tax=Coffea arabica TaxID=13443 RepID=A0ABM4UAK7_COFAR